MAANDQALESHEEEHAEIARRWAPTFKERLLNQRKRQVPSRYRQTLRRVDRETKRFDQHTQHGKTQGVSPDMTIQ